MLAISKRLRTQETVAHVRFQRQHQRQHQCQRPRQCQRQRQCPRPPLNVTHRKGDILVVLDPRFAVGAVEDDTCGVDANTHMTYLLFAKPHRGGLADSRELLAVDGFRREDRARASARTHLAHDEKRASSGDDVELERPHAYIAPGDGEAAFFQELRNRRFAAAGEVTSRVR